MIDWVVGASKERVLLWEFRIQLRLIPMFLLSVSHIFETNRQQVLALHAMTANNGLIPAQPSHVWTPSYSWKKIWRVMISFLWRLSSSMPIEFLPPLIYIYLWPKQWDLINHGTSQIGQAFSTPALFVHELRVRVQDIFLGDRAFAIPGSKTLVQKVKIILLVCWNQQPASQQPSSYHPIWQDNVNSFNKTCLHSLLPWKDTTWCP